MVVLPLRNKLQHLSLQLKVIIRQAETLSFRISLHFLKTTPRKSLDVMFGKFYLFFPHIAFRYSWSFWLFLLLLFSSLHSAAFADVNAKVNNWCRVKDLLIISPSAFVCFLNTAAWNAPEMNLMNYLLPAFSLQLNQKLLLILAVAFFFFLTIIRAPSPFQAGDWCMNQNWLGHSAALFFCGGRLCCRICAAQTGSRANPAQLIVSADKMS